MGLMRWSYPGRAGGFRSASDQIETVRERLYQPSRLEHRLFLLEHLVLPGLRAQTDQDFTIIMLVGDQLPAKYRSKIEALIAGVPQIRLIAYEEGRKLKALSRRLFAQFDDGKRPIAGQFRLDDDDAISKHFVARTRYVFEEIRPIYEKAELFGVDFTKGFTLRTEPENLEIRPIVARFWAPGTVIFIPKGHDSSLLDFHHLQLWHEMPTLMWKDDDPMFIRGVHHSNDSDTSHVGRRMKSFRLTPEEVAPMAEEHFGLNVKEMSRIWQGRWQEFMSDGALGAVGG